MRNLLNESFSRLFKTKSFKVCLILVILIPVLIISVSKYLSTRFVDDVEVDMTADSCLFFMLGMLPLFIAISPGLFIAKDFQQNTIRNKIISGYSRTAIYMTNWITCSFITLLFHIMSTIVSVGVAAVLFDIGDLFTKVNLYYSLACIPVLLSFNSITVAMTMSIRNTAGAIFSYFIHELSAMFTGIMLLIKNKTVVEFLNYFIPMSQLSIIQSRNSYGGFAMMMEDIDILDMAGYAIPKGFDAVALPLYAAILAAAVTALGIWNFNKKDIK